MALILCPECSKQISDKATSCPNCGYPFGNEVSIGVEGEIQRTNDVKDVLPAKAESEISSEVMFGQQEKKSVQPKFYQKMWFVVLMLLLFFPVGAFLMWKHKRLNPIVRIIASILFGANFLFWTAVFIACLLPCDHDWEEATCTSPRVCWICGETEGEPLGHKWMVATYSMPKTCAVCGETEGECLERAEAFSSAGAISAIEECFEFIPNCELGISQESNAYVIKNNNELVGIIGLDIDDFDALALIDPDIENAVLYHRQVAIAMLLSSDSDMTYKEAEDYFKESCEEGLIWVNGYASFVSEGIAEGMYAFGIGY